VIDTYSRSSHQAQSGTKLDHFRISGWQVVEFVAMMQAHRLDGFNNGQPNLSEHFYAEGCVLTAEPRSGTQLATPWPRCQITACGFGLF
jgi:hypothetical protein